MRLQPPQTQGQADARSGIPSPQVGGAWFQIAGHGEAGPGDGLPAKGVGLLVLAAEMGDITVLPLIEKRLFPYDRTGNEYVRETRISIHPGHNLSIGSPGQFRGIQSLEPGGKKPRQPFGEQCSVGDSGAYGLTVGSNLALKQLSGDRSADPVGVIVVCAICGHR